MATKLTKHITFGDVSSDIPNGYPLIVNVTTYQFSSGRVNLENDITGYDNISYYDTFLNKTIQYSDFKTEVQRRRPVLLNWDFAIEGGDLYLTFPLNAQTYPTTPLKFEYKGLINDVPTDTWATSSTSWKSYIGIISLDCIGATPVFNYKKIARVGTDSALVITGDTISLDPGTVPL